MEADGDGAFSQFAAERLARAVESGPDGVLILDLAGTVQFANSSAVAMLGARDEAALLGAPLGDVVGRAGSRRCEGRA